MTVNVKVGNPFLQESVDKGKSSGNEVISAQEAADLKMKEKRKREREVLVLDSSFTSFK